MQRVLIDLDGNGWGNTISLRLVIPLVSMTIRCFPDRETYVRITSNVRNKEVIIIRSLNDPNAKTIELILLCNTLRENGAKRVGLIAPYLAYMRQDKQFKSGEGISAKYYAALLSKYFDWFITVDPHLHRINSLRQIFSI
jgi:ribose-phosphate pyrophosphokinase